MGRLPQFVGQAAVAAGLLAGGASLLNAGGAMAGPCPPGVILSNITTTDPASLTCDGFDPPFEADILTTFTPKVNGPAIGTVKYKLQASPDWWWTSVELDSQHQGTGVKVVKEVFKDEALLIPLSASLTSSDGSNAGPTPISDAPNIVWVRDSYTVDSSGALVSINNEFTQVPGPLPILGAGAAFGFSRKLRGRIKAGRTA